MKSTIIEQEACPHKRKISWTAILTGTLVCLGLSFLLNLFSIAIGLSLAPTGKTGMMALAIGGFIGMGIGVVAVMFVSGFVAGALGKPYNPERNLGIVYGFATWSLALLITILLTGQIGKYVKFYSDFASNPSVVINSDKSYPFQRGNFIEAKNNALQINASNTNQNVMDAKTQKVANAVGVSSLSIFVLFFLGAFASALGGHCGMTCECKKSKKRK